MPTDSTVFLMPKSGLRTPAGPSQNGKARKVIPQTADMLKEDERDKRKGKGKGKAVLGNVSGFVTGQLTSSLDRRATQIFF